MDGAGERFGGRDLARRAPSAQSFHGLRRARSLRSALLGVFAVALGLGAPGFLGALGCGDAGREDDAGATPTTRPPVPRDAAAEAREDDADPDPADGSTSDASLPAVDAGRDVPTCAPGGGAGARIRIVAANLSTTNQRWAEPGRRILAGLAPDVVLLQEMSVATDTDDARRAFVESALGAGTTLVRGPAAEIPNAIATKLPVLRSGSFEDVLVANRTFVWALVDLPGPTDLFAVSVHLLTSSSANRAAEARNLVDFLRREAPTDAYLVVGGDLNTDTRAEPCLDALGDLLAVGGPYPADRLGDGDTNAPRSRPYDWVLADRGLSSCATPVRLGASVFPTGLVADTRVYAPIAELAPATAEESAAAGMQHMAVVRDFVLP